MSRTTILCITIAALAGCKDKPDDFFSGYAEADYVRLSSPVAGTLTKLHFNRGDKAAKNAAAFVLEQESERAAREEASSRVRRAQAQLVNLEKGRRPDEIVGLEAQLAQVEAALKLSTADFNRQKQLVASGFISAARLDEARAAVERDRAHVNELRAQLRVGRLGGRSDEIEAARQDLKAANAQLEQADWKIEQKTQRIPIDADVADVLYREGEWVPAGSPVVSLLPAQNIKVRFFVPETVLGKVRAGQDVSLRCDGCGNAIPAKISYIAREAEYTSPLIYSKENRSTLVFMIEARPSMDAATRLHPGQPIEVRLAERSPQPAQQ